MKKRRKGGRKNFIDMTNTSNYDKNYDSLDESCTDRKTIDDYLEFIKMGSQIKLNLVKHTKEENTIFLLRVLRSIINEQVLADY
jgi:hypothetical protein